jgi:WhiB family redox-sensing transcriptional regulator
MDEMIPPPDHAEQQWMLHARCRSLAPGEFFPSDGVGVDKARQICAQCSVVDECLEYALRYRIDHGVWGGASERERRRILRRRRSEIADPGAARRGAHQATSSEPDLGEPVTIG